MHRSAGASGGQEKALDPLGVELQMAVSHTIGAGSQTQVLCNNTKCLTTEPPLCPSQFLSDGHSYMYINCPVVRPYSKVQILTTNIGLSFVNILWAGYN